MKPLRQHLPGLAVFGWALLIGCALAGCSPKNPLDHTVDASNPGTFLAWWNHERRSLPDPLLTEVDDAFTLIQNSIIRRFAVDLNSSNDPFCVKVNGMRLRDVLIDAYLEKNNFLLKRIALATDNLAAITNNSSNDDNAKTEARRDLVLKRQQEIITEWKAELARNEARIAELKVPGER